MKAKKIILTSLKYPTKFYNTGIYTISKENLHPDIGDEQESKESWLKCRYVVTLIWFLLYCYSSGCRINMSVTIVAMVNSFALTKQTKNTSDSCPDTLMNLENATFSSEDVYTKTGEFDWSPELQGYIHSSYYLTNVLVLIPAGLLAERYGFKWITFGGTFVAAIATLLLPLTARLHPYAFMVMQVLRGGGFGTYQTSAALTSANWFPNPERGRLYSFIISGFPMGSFIFGIFSGLLCKSSLLGGWPSSFYASGLIGLILSFLVAYCFHESPSVHPRISKAELKYILNNQENALPRKRPNPPWRKMLSSVPVYALAVGHFGQIWALSQFHIMNSTFLGTILHYPIDQNGYLSGVPYLLMFLFTQSSAWLSTFMTTRKYASVDQVRKTCNFTACLGFSLCLLGIYFSGCNKSWNSAFTVLSLGFIGIAMAGVWIVSTDMSPTFSASLKSITLTFALLPSFILPLVVGYLTNERQTLEQWNKIFFINIGVVVTSGLVFSCCGSAEVQPWNFVDKDKKEEEDKYTSVL